MDFRTAFKIVYGREPTMAEFSANMYDQGASIIAQANQIVADRTPVVETPPAVVETPPAVVETPPAVVETPPTVVETPPTVVETPPTVVETPPAVEDPVVQDPVLDTVPEIDTTSVGNQTVQNVRPVEGGFVVTRNVQDPNSVFMQSVEFFVPSSDVISTEDTFRNFGQQTDIVLPSNYSFDTKYTPTEVGGTQTDTNTKENEQVVLNKDDNTLGSNLTITDATLGNVGEVKDEVKDEVKEEVKKDESQAEGTESIASTPDAYNRTFARDVTDFFLRTVNRLPSQGELEAYKKNYFIPDQNDYTFSKLDQEQGKKDLMDERVSTFGLPGQIDELYKRAFGKGPTAQESTDAAEFFNKIGQYTTDPRKITAPDAQRFKEQVITPQELSKIPVNVNQRSNLPTTFLTSPYNEGALDSDGVPIPTRSVSDFAITGGVSPLPTDAPTTPPVPTSITPDTDVYSEAYFRDKFLPQEDSAPVGLHSGGDPVVEMMRKKQTPQTRAREDLNRILGK